jgi:hypothetical protein
MTARGVRVADSSGQLVETQKAGRLRVRLPMVSLT